MDNKWWGSFTSEPRVVAESILVRIHYTQQPSRLYHACKSHTYGTQNCHQVRRAKAVTSTCQREAPWIEGRRAKMSSNYLSSNVFVCVCIHKYRIYMYIYIYIYIHMPTKAAHFSKPDIKVFMTSFDIPGQFFNNASQSSNWNLWGQGTIKAFQDLVKAHRVQAQVLDGLDGLTFPEVVWTEVYLKNKWCWWA